jgi:ATP-dependent Lhr-like helicase
VRNTPVLLLPREHLAQWRAPVAGDSVQLSAAASRVAEALRAHGASFFLDLVQDTGLLRTQVETALGELVAQGLVTADSFAGLRALITPQQRRPGFASTRRRRGAVAGVGAAGRWALIRERNAATTDGAGPDAEHFVELLLARYGIVFRRLLEREPHAPAWRELLYVLRRMEARGELRGGRFVSGMSGEQFALPEAVGSLRELQRRDPDGSLYLLSAVDPLNLAGIITPGERLAAQPANRVLYRDGVPVALAAGGEPRFLQELDAESLFSAREMLARGRWPRVPVPAGPL